MLNPRRSDLSLDDPLPFDDPIPFEGLLSLGDGFLHSIPWSQQTSNEATAAQAGGEAQQHLPYATSVLAYPEIDTTPTAQPFYQFESLPYPNCKGTGKVSSYQELYERLKRLEKRYEKLKARSD